MTVVTMWPMIIVHATSRSHYAPHAPSTSASTSELDQYLGVPLNTLVKLLIRRRRVVNVDFVGHDKARLGAAGDDEVA